MAPSGRELAAQLTEGECVMLKSANPDCYAGSHHHYRGPPPSRREALLKLEIDNLRCAVCVYVKGEILVLFKERCRNKR